MSLAAILILVVTMATVSTIDGHAVLMEPPGRSTLWRFGYGTLPNYSDNQLFCGGYQTQYETNGGKCGVCGDAYNAAEPRENEANGKYGKGILSAFYKPNQDIKIEVLVTANHFGFFEFRLCPNNDTRKEATKECLDDHVLQLSDGSGTKYYIPKDLPNYETIKLTVKSPKDLVCTQCVIQMNYNTGNSWGICPDGTGDIGCGDQETFRGCADIAILP